MKVSQDSMELATMSAMYHDPLRIYHALQHESFVVQDLPMVIEGKNIDDVEVLFHDITTPRPTKGTPYAQAHSCKPYYPHSVCHDHDDDMCRTFLAQIANVMSPDSRLLVHDILIDDVQPEQYSTRADFIIMSLFGSMERSETQLGSLLEGVGLRVTGSHKPGPEQWTTTETML